VGFIRDLPHNLVEAFEATLREAIEADLLLHVVDASNPAVHDQMLEVQRVLREIGADDIEQVIVCNKVDAMEVAQQPTALRDKTPLITQAGDSPDHAAWVERVFTSARTGLGLAQLRTLLAEKALNHASMRLDSAQSASNSDVTQSDLVNDTQ
jgi:GTPase